MSRRKPRRDRHDDTATLTLAVPEVAHERYGSGSPGLAAEVAAAATRPRAPQQYATDTGGWPALAARHARPPAVPVPPCRCGLCLWAMDVAGTFDGPCRCDSCKYDQGPATGRGVVLYAEPGGEMLRILHGIRDGWLEDIPAFAAQAAAGITTEFTAAHRHASRTIESGYRRCVALLRTQVAA
jgi:hypothetical protein